MLSREIEVVGMIQQLMSAINASPGTTIHLYQNDVTPTEDTLVGDLTEATFTGYSAFGGTEDWEQAVDPFTGKPTLQLTLNPVFTATDGASPNVVYGWYATYGGEGTFLGAWRFPVPVPILTAGNAVALACTILFNTPFNP